MKILKEVFTWLNHYPVVPRGFIVPPPKDFIIPPVPCKTALELDASYPSIVGVYDLRDNGWTDINTKTLYPGFTISDQDVVVDVGCGDAGFLHFAGICGAHIVAADISQDKVDAAVRSLKTTRARQVDGVAGDSNPLQIQDSFATRVICTEVVEHVDDPAQFLSELVRIGQPGALYFISVPDSVCEYAQKNSVAPKSCFEHPNHIRIIERDEFANMIRDAGLVIQKHDTYSFFSALSINFFWYCYSKKGELSTSDPLALSWAKTWHMFLAMPKSKEVRALLDEVFPKSQVIIARKPV